MAAESEEDSYMWMDDDPGPAKKSCTADKKRRFSDDQVKSLELMFESQAKLEPRKKLQLAKDLGLHPRQVAIWFQNKRARWKSKQLEREYNTLKSDYDSLLSNFESLKNEKQALTKQLHRLVELLNKPGEERRTEDETPSTESEERSDVRLMMCLNDNDEENRYGGTPRFREKESDLYPVEDDTLVPSEHQFWPSEQPGAATSQWWDFWPLNG